MNVSVSGLHASFTSFKKIYSANSIIQTCLQIENFCFEFKVCKTEETFQYKMIGKMYISRRVLYRNDNMKLNIWVIHVQCTMPDKEYIY